MKSHLALKMDWIHLSHSMAIASVSSPTTFHLKPLRQSRNQQGYSIASSVIQCRINLRFDISSPCLLVVSSQKWIRESQIKRAHYHPQSQIQITSCYSNAHDRSQCQICHTAVALHTMQVKESELLERGMQCCDAAMVTPLQEHCRQCRKGTLRMGK